MTETPALDGLRVLLTGASGGIGSATARKLAALGARIVLHGHRNMRGLEALAMELDGGRHSVVTADLADPDEARALVRSAAHGLGGIDLLINNAGVYLDHPPDSTIASDWLECWRKTLDINLLAPALLCHEAAMLMKDNGGGRIINVSSRGAFRGEPTAPAYGASKSGLNSMSQSLAQALARDNILVFAIAPGFVETEMAAEMLSGPGGDSIRAQSPLERVARPDEIAGLIAFLSSPGCDYLTGSIIDINGASYLRH